MRTAEEAFFGDLAWAGREAGQINEGSNGAADDVPIADRNWYYRLDLRTFAVASCCGPTPP